MCGFILTMSDARDRIIRAIDKFSQKNDGLPKQNRKKKHNDNVEGPVCLAIKNHLKSIGWSVDIVEAKGVFNESAGQYAHGKTRPGFSDICGCMPNGIACYIEVKAPGKRSTMRPDQEHFLVEKISTNAFAIVADSVEYVMRVFNEWQSADNKKAYLLHELPSLAPRFKKMKNEDLNFDD